MLANHPRAPARLLLALLLAACRPATPTPTPPTASPTPANAWLTYADAEHGFAFDYPAFYGETTLCAVEPDGETAVLFGSEARLDLLPDASLELDDFVAQAAVEFDKADGPYTPVVRELEPNPGGGPRGLLVEGLSAGHGVTYAYFRRPGTIFRFFERHNAGCMAPDLGLTNPGIFYQIVETFRFL